MSYSDLPLFQDTEGPRGAVVRCACGITHRLYGWQSARCDCGWKITLEETAGGAFRARANRENDTNMLKPIPQIVEWIS